MKRVVWLNGGFVDDDHASLSIDDPAVRYGEGLFETMLAVDGELTHIDRHLDRLTHSSGTLGMTGLPSRTALENAAHEVARRFPEGLARVRLTATPYPTVLVEGTTEQNLPLRHHTAVSLRGAWRPENHVAEHKTLSSLALRLARHTAARAGADTALLLDSEGRLGEASYSNAFCVRDGDVFTAPAAGLLPGTTRARVCEMIEVTEVALSEDLWRSADEVFTTSAVTLVAAIIAVDGARIGDGQPGEVTRAVATMLAPASKEGGD